MLVLGIVYVEHYLFITIVRYTFNYEGEMIEVATDRESLGHGVEIFVNIARMLFETLEGQVFKVKEADGEMIF